MGSFINKMGLAGGYGLNGAAALKVSSMVLCLVKPFFLNNVFQSVYAIAVCLILSYTTGRGGYADELFDGRLWSNDLKVLMMGKVVMT